MIGCANSKQLNKQSAVKEVNNFFNSQYSDYAADLTITGAGTTRLGRFYNDEDKVINTYQSNVNEVKTKEYSYIQGYGFKCYIEDDNSKLFVPTTYFDYAKYISEAEYSKDDSRLKFEMDFDKMSAVSGIFGESSLTDALNELGVVLKKVPFEAYFNQDKKLYSLSMLISDMYKEYSLLGITIRLRFTVVQYGKDFKKEEFKTDDYQKVDYYDYDIIEHSIAECMQGEKGLFFDEEYFREPFRNEIPQDTVVGHVCLNSINLKEPIYFKDLTYNEKGSYYYFFYATRQFKWVPPVPTVTYLKRSNTITPTSEIKHDVKDALVEDYDNQRILLESDNKVIVLDYSLNIIKEYEVEGEIMRILCHDDVYHITTVTESPDSSWYNDYDCYGNIYVIDKTSLEIKESIIHINCCPCYTIVDKRGDILITPGCGQGSLVSIYRSNEKKLERLEITGYLPGDKCEVGKEYYLAYYKDQDLVVMASILSTGGHPYFIDYKDGQYTCRYYWDYKGEQLQFEYLVLAYKDYLVTPWKLVDVSDWNNPITKRTDDQKIAHRRTEVAFAHNDYVYWLQGDYDENAYLQTVELKDDKQKMYQYMLEDKYSDFTFGFSTDSAFYMFNNKENAFYEYTR